MLDYLRALFDLLHTTLWFHPNRLQLAALSDDAGWLAGGVVGVAALSTLIGESVVLFINRVTFVRFALSFLLNGVLFCLDIVVAATFSWMLGEVLFPESPNLSPMLFLVSINTAPFIFGIFILIPYAGTLVGRVLQVWRFLLMLGAVQVYFNAPFGLALAAITFGWVMMLITNNAMGRPAMQIRERLWQTLVGFPVHQPLDPFVVRFRRMVRRYSVGRQKGKG